MRKNCELGRYVLSKCGADKKEFLSAVYKRRTQAKKHRLDVPQFGRSMVEMLGVLAIIGVLSVGGIAGYSKAMFKYKLNKQTEQLSQLLNALYRYKASWGENPPSMDLMPYFKALGEIPEDMIKDNTTYIYDIFGTTIELRTNGCDPLCNNVRLSYKINNKNSFEICNNVFEVMKGFRSELYAMIVGKNSGGSISYNGYIYGDKFCSGSKKCLSNITKKEIYDECQYCAQSDSCFFDILYKIDD